MDKSKKPDPKKPWCPRCKAHTEFVIAGPAEGNKYSRCKNCRGTMFTPREESSDKSCVGCLVVLMLVVGLLAYAAVTMGMLDADTGPLGTFTICVIVWKLFLAAFTFIILVKSWHTYRWRKWAKKNGYPEE